MAAFLSGAERQDMVERTAAGLPLKRIGKPEEIGVQVVHLMQTRLMTGSVMLVDGSASVAWN